MVGNIFLHLAVEGVSADIRRLAVSSMNTQAPVLPEVVNRIVSASLKVYLTKSTTPSKAQTLIDETETKAVSKEGRLCAFLISCAAVGEDVDRTIREKLALDLVVVSHHPAIGTSIHVVGFPVLNTGLYSWEWVTHSMDRPLPSSSRRSPCSCRITLGSYLIPGYRCL